MCLALRLRSLCLPLAKIAIPTWSIAIISAVSLHLLPKRMSLAPTEERQLSRTAQARERISRFITTPARSGPTRLRRQILPRSYSPGAQARTAAARPGLQLLMERVILLSGWPVLEVTSAYTATMETLALLFMPAAGLTN